jgi:glutathione S-transferase
VPGSGRRPQAADPDSCRIEPFNWEVEMIKLMEFHRSGNCVKVRIALNYKGIPFETEEMSGADRSPLIRAANWPFVPVIVDGDVVMRDSEAILQYLEANYRDRPSLTPATAEEIRQGDALLAETRSRVGPILGRMYGQGMKAPADRDPRALAGIGDELVKAVEPLEKALEGKKFLLGDRMSYHDILIAGALWMTRPRPEFIAVSPIWAFFAEHISLPARFKNLHAWLDRVLAYDREPAGASA